MEPMLNEFTREEVCVYKGRRYHVRDNGAVYRQCKEDGIIDALLDKCSDFFTKEQLSYLKECLKKAFDTPADQQESLYAEIMAEMQKMGLVQDENAEEDPAKAIRFVATCMDGMRSLADGDVWFMIHERYGRYQIGLYYDNLHNQAHGEDL